jgi:hypothetical protein
MHDRAATLDVPPPRKRGGTIADGSLAAPSTLVPRAGVPERSITGKAILAGLVGIVAIGLGANTNDRVLELPSLIGNHLPVAVFSFVLMLAAAWNPLLGRIRPSWCFSARELAVVLGMLLITSWIPCSSFYRYFQYQLILPWAQAPAHPQWTEQGTLDYLPGDLFPLHHDPGTPASAERQAYDRVYGSFAGGEAAAGAPMAWTQAPYRAFAPVMASWGPLVLSLGICLMSMIWLLHRQWSHHEQLQYPIAAVATALIARSGARLTSDIFHSPRFWLGFAPIFAIHLVDYLAAWFPERVPPIALDISCYDLHRFFPVLDQVRDYTTHLHLYFIIVGIAYLIPSEIGLSCGLSTLVFTLVTAQAYLVTGIPATAGDAHCVQAGGYLAYFILLVVVARHYLWSLLTRSFALRAAAETDRERIWAARLFLVSGAVFTAGLIWLFHLDWFAAGIYTASLLVYFVVFARVVAESGIPFMVAEWDPGQALCQVLGVPAIGPTAAVVMLYLNGVLNPDNRECITPYVANTLRISEQVGAPRPGIIGVAVLGMVVALIVGLVGQTSSLYHHGAWHDPYAMSRPEFVIDRGTRALSDLRDSGLFAVSAQTHGLAKLGLVGANAGHAREIGWMGVGISGVLLFALLRARVPWWPLHPVVFVLWGTWTSSYVWLSFLIGWAVKQSIVRFGGGRVYLGLKPLFIGMIMGEILAMALQLLVGWSDYAITGGSPKSVFILPP